MAYTINKTDGSILTSVPDGQVDTFSSDIGLIGKNYSGFGEILNENFIKMLENFASVSRPKNPLKGELWFDSSESRLKVYNGTDFATVGSAAIAALQPTSLNPGDLWFDELGGQLYFYDGTNTILIGPLFSKLQGLSGFRIEDILDTQNNTRTVAGMYVGGTLIGYFSKDSFTPKIPPLGFSGTITQGFNMGSTPGLKITATVTNAEQLAGKDAGTYLNSDGDNSINGTLNIGADGGLAIGRVNGNGQFIIDGGDVVVTNTAVERDFRISVRKSLAAEIALNVRTSTRTLELYGGLSDSTVITGGSLIVQGNLTVNGTTTTVNSVDLTVEDKNIELGKTANPTDENADGGGIILKGDTDHSLYWVYNSAEPVAGGVEANGAWNSTEHVNLIGKSFKIDGVEVLSGTSLGSGVTSAPGITSFGNQTFLNVDDIFLDGNTIAITATNTDLIITPNGSGTLNLSNKRISNLANPVNPGDASNKSYTDFTIRGMPLVFSIDVSGLTSADISAYLTILAPPESYRVGTDARLLCTAYNNTTVSLELNSKFTKSFVNVSTLPSGTSSVVQNFSIPTQTVSAPTIEITRAIRIFRIQQSGPDDQVWIEITPPGGVPLPSSTVII
jgi:hypothetical protein